MKSIHRAWLVCLGCMILLFCCTGLAANCFTIYLPFIMEQNGFTNTQSSMIITMRGISSMCAMLLAGVYYQHISIRRGMVLACLAASCGFFVYGMAGSWAMYLSGSFLVGIGYGLASTIPVGILLNRWFAKSLTFATGICTSVTGLATLGIPSLITWCVGRYGLGRTLVVEGIVIAVLGLLSLLLLVDFPADKGCRPYGDGETVSDVKTVPNAETVRNAEAVRNAETVRSAETDPDAETVRSAETDPDAETVRGAETVRSAEMKKGSGKDDRGKYKKRSYHPILTRRNRYLLMPIIMLTGTFCSVSYAHLSVFMTTNGISKSDVAIVVMISGLGLTVGKLLFGWAADKTSVYFCTACFGFFLVFGLLLSVVTAGQLIPMAIGTLLSCIGMSIGTIGLVIWPKELSAPEDYADNNRFFLVCFSLGATLFASVPGMIADRWGSYSPFYVLTAICSLTVILVMRAVYRKAMN